MVFVCVCACGSDMRVTHLRRIASRPMESLQSQPLLPVETQAYALAASAAAVGIPAALVAGDPVAGDPAAGGAVRRRPAALVAGDPFAAPSHQVIVKMQIRSASRAWLVGPGHDAQVRVVRNDGTIVMRMMKHTVPDEHLNSAEDIMNECCDLMNNGGTYKQRKNIRRHMFAENAKWPPRAIQ